MKVFRFARFFIPLFIITCLAFHAFSGDAERAKYSSVQRLVSEGVLKVMVMGTGGHEGECMLMSLENPSPDTAFILIEPGRVLSSLDTAVQDILITREEMLALAPGEQREIGVYGFCSQASHASPDSAEMFGIGEMADSSIVALAEFLNDRNNDFPEDAIQKAVWCMTDDHNILDIYGEDLASIADLRNMVASLKGLDAMWFEVDDVPYDGQLFTNYRQTISGEIEIFIPEDCLVDIYIRDEDGIPWDEFEKQVPYKAGAYSYEFRITATNWPQGKYYLCVRGNGKLLYEKAFQL